ncbi:Galactose-binding domain-like protein [Pseudohyphozyma bogoriensis]|nr:Galactose-binding domain-like protein [Pseudohyphozyma bogoriensis]
MHWKALHLRLLWEPQNGTGYLNYSRLPSTCDVSGSPADATPIQMPLKDPVFCPDSLDDCTTGATRPIYYYNNDYWNIEWVSTTSALGTTTPGDGPTAPSNDIFMTAAEAKAYVRPTYTLNATSHYLGGYLDSGNGTDSEEWSSNGETTGAWLQLTWPHAVTINQVVLYDRPNWEDHCTAGKLTFADAATSSSVKSTSAVPSTTTSQEVTATAKLTSELAARLSSVAAARAKAAAGTKAARSFDGEYEVTPTPAPTATSLCAIPTPTTVDYTTKVCVGRVCTNKATQTVLSATPCATPTQAFQVEMMPDEAGLPFLDNLPFEAGFDVQERG